MVRLWIKDMTDGSVHEYGTNHHDSLRVCDGVLTYENLQNGDGSPTGYCFCNEDGTTDWLDNAKEDYNETYVDIGGIHHEKTIRELESLLCDVNPNEIMSQIESGNLDQWCALWKDYATELTAALKGGVSRCVIAGELRS